MNKWFAIGGTFCDGFEKPGEVLKRWSRRWKHDPRDNIRIGTLRESGDLNRHLEISECNSQIEQRRTTTDDEFPIKRIDIRQAAGAIGTKEQLITIDYVSPRLSVVARRRQDSVANRKARLVDGGARRREIGRIHSPRSQVASSHVSVPVKFSPADKSRKMKSVLGVFALSNRYPPIGGVDVDQNWFYFGGLNYLEYPFSARQFGYADDREYKYQLPFLGRSWCRVLIR